ncbi:hypothetical protein SNE25_22865 [Mucilaginibacter sabulilitoris]|uniref:Uncharacterized protein n=1 Tax=Mucilaginibacter sabulilitoris TaxID=1173583 RepID=A0ABZ0TID8_9SPHI|nr:hypothetical protein [Mucilaginibacter sabulilitoris]WPU92167.1 hypothetical protein SNE25_22865 [Mucilaginibacter sabulilitoris]
MEDNKDQNPLPTGENNPGELKSIPVKQQNKGAAGMKIVGINILVLVIYTSLLTIGTNGGGFIFDAFLILAHVIVCIVMAITKRSWIWLLSAILVLAIGFSTCVSFGGL